MNYGSIIDMFFPCFFFPASYFMSYHKILKTSPEYTAALKSAREIAKNINYQYVLSLFFFQPLTLCPTTKSLKLHQSTQQL